MILINDNTITGVVISTAFGFGNGLPYYRYKKDYKSLLDVTKRLKVSTITKSFTRDPLKGNFRLWNPFTWGHIQKIHGGIYNNYGLTNPGWHKVKSEIDLAGNHVIPNIWSENFHDYADTILFISPKIIEINFSCPNKLNNVDYPLLISALKKWYPDMIIIVKIGITFDFDLIQNIVDAGADILHSINSVPVSYFHYYVSSQYAKYKQGAISGKPITPISLKFNEKLRSKVSIPIIMGGGITTLEDAKLFKDIGADSLSICSAVLLDPDVAKTIIMEYY